MWDHCSESKTFLSIKRKVTLPFVTAMLLKILQRKKSKTPKYQSRKHEKIGLEMVSLPEKLIWAKARASKTRRMHTTHNVTTLHCGNCNELRSLPRQITSNHALRLHFKRNKIQHIEGERTGKDPADDDM
jgi:hypothetical protein